MRDTRGNMPTESFMCSSLGVGGTNLALLHLSVAPLELSVTMA